MKRFFILKSHWSYIFSLTPRHSSYSFHSWEEFELKRIIKISFLKLQIIFFSIHEWKRNETKENGNERIYFPDFYTRKKKEWVMMTVLMILKSIKTFSQKEEVKFSWKKMNKKKEILSSFTQIASDYTKIINFDFSHSHFCLLILLLLLLLLLLTSSLVRIVDLLIHFKTRFLCLHLDPSREDL